MLAAQVADDRLVHPVAAHADRPGIDDVAQRQHRNLGRAAADVDDHVAGRVGDRHARADGGGDGLGDEPGAARAGRQTDWRIARFSTGVAPWARRR
jgi:hypothetical protein